MQKILKNYLKSNKTIFDIILYGSSIKGADSPNDIDILIIFNIGTLEERLNIIQNLKIKLNKQIKNLKSKFDIKQIIITDLFKTEFLARTGIIIEGISIKTSKKFSENLGMKAKTLFVYSLNKLDHKNKVRFNYILAGRNSQGILKEFKAKRLASGVIEIPIENSIPFENILKNNNVTYNKKNILYEL